MRPPGATDSYGVFWFLTPSGRLSTVSVQIPPGTQPSPANVGDDTFDSDGSTRRTGQQCSEGCHGRRHRAAYPTSDSHKRPCNSLAQALPGTGKIILRHGRFRRSRSAEDDVTTMAQALALLDTPGKDKTLTMFSSLVPAMLNVLVGNDSSCVCLDHRSGEQVDAEVRPGR